MQTPLKTFASAKWGIALEYPATWSVEDDGDEVTFRGEGGQPIVLGRVGSDNPSEPPRGRRTAAAQCSTTTTANDVQATMCVDPASQTHHATLILNTRDGRQSRLAIRTRGRDSQIVDAIVSSVRRYP